MARTEIPIVVIDPATGNAVSGASVTVVNRATSSNATIYAGETGGTTVANPRTTDANGRLTGWVERGPYRLDITGSSLTSYSKNWDSAPASDAAIDVLWLPQAWTTYTATVTAPTNPTLGTGGTQVGYYSQLGKTVTARFKIQFGTAGVAAGTGTYYVALPLTAAAAQVGIPAGNGFGFDSSAFALSPFTATCDTTSRLSFFHNTTLNGAYANLAAAAPWTWAANDYFTATVTYEAA
jgi:hypothetical protein